MIFIGQKDYLDDNDNNNQIFDEFQYIFAMFVPVINLTTPPWHNSASEEILPTGVRRTWRIVIIYSILRLIIPLWYEHGATKIWCWYEEDKDWDDNDYKESLLKTPDKQIILLSSLSPSALVGSLYVPVTNLDCKWLLIIM